MQSFSAHAPRILARHTRIAVAAIGSLAFLGCAFLLLRSSNPQAHVAPSGIPLPFGSSDTRLRSEITFVGKRNGIDVYEVTYTNGEVAETFLPDRIYLVHVPVRADATQASMDAVFSAVASNGRDIDFFGYKYTDADASAERSNINSFLFKDRFPGQFFASGKARAQDATHGNMLAAFEAANGVTFRRTDASPGSVFLEPAGSLFVFVVNEPTGARFHVRRSGICGNAVLEPTEECDDGNADAADACTRECRYGIPIPFGSDTRSSSVPLSITVQQTAVNATAVHGQTGVVLFQIVANASQDIRLQKIRLAASRGSVSNANRYSLWRDSDADGRVDASVQSNVPPAGDIVSFDALEGAEGVLISAGVAMVFQVHADIGEPPPSDRLLLALAQSEPDFVAGAFASGQGPLSGIRLDGVCAAASCDIAVATAASVLWRFVPSVVCGNGILQSDEQCDEGGHNGTVCTPSSGSSCTYCSTDCREVSVGGGSICGNGILDGGESCDDGGGHDGDGCSSVCSIESGFLCTGAPSVCSRNPTAVCGDGTDEGSEACDDGNTLSGDGCSDVCGNEAGYSCNTIPTPNVCSPACGDGLIKGSEQCDDGNAQDGDGCGDSCTVEPGFSCTDSDPSVCTRNPTTACGNGVTEAGEECDDGDAQDGDGCSAACTIDQSYRCTGQPSVCSAGNTVSTIDSGNRVGQYSSLAIGTDGLPVISYYDATWEDLRVTHCGNRSCSDSNSMVAVDARGNAVGWYSSIAIGTDGYPVISYWDQTHGDLKVVKCGNAACSSGNTTTTVDSTGDVGSYTSIAIGTDGYPVISYYDGTNYDLKVAACDNGYCDLSGPPAAGEAPFLTPWSLALVLAAAGLCLRRMDLVPPPQAV